MFKSLMFNLILNMNSSALERSSHPSRLQTKVLLDILEANPSFSYKGPVSRKAWRKSWAALAHHLNGLGGSKKTPKQWIKYWADKKLAVKKKAIAKHSLRSKTNSSAKKIKFSKREERILALIGCQDLIAGDKQSSTSHSDDSQDLSLQISSDEERDHQTPSSTQTRPQSSQSIQFQPIVPKPIPSQPILPKPIPSQPILPKPIPSQAILPRPILPKPTVPRPIQSQPIKVQLIQTQPIQSQPTQSQPIQTQPIISQPIQPQPSSFSAQPIENNRTEDQTRYDEKWETIGRSIGLQLRDMDKTQRMVAHKLINDVMYYGESGLLSHHCSISIPQNISHAIPVSRDINEYILTVQDPLS